MCLAMSFLMKLFILALVIIFLSILSSSPVLISFSFLSLFFRWFCLHHLFLLLFHIHGLLLLSPCLILQDLLRNHLHLFTTIPPHPLPLPHPLLLLQPHPRPIPVCPLPLLPLPHHHPCPYLILPLNFVERFNMVNSLMVQ
jgi:hypothetical protein